MDCVGKLEACVTPDSTDGDNTYRIENSSGTEDECQGSLPSGSHEDHTYCRPLETADDYVEEKHEPFEVPPNDTNACMSSARLHNADATDFIHNEVAPPRVDKPTGPPLVYVRSDKTWKFQKQTVVATCGEDGQFVYHPDPFSPAPPFKGSPSAVKRMEYAAKRIDNRKYRGQRDKVIASDQLDSATCSRCHMRFFLPFRHFKNRITYAVPENPYLLPMPRFRCPLCEHYSIIELYI